MATIIKLFLLERQSILDSDYTWNLSRIKVRKYFAKTNRKVARVNPPLEFLIASFHKLCPREQKMTKLQKIWIFFVIPPFPHKFSCFQDNKKQFKG